VREILESLPEEERVAYTTVQTLVYRLEEKDTLRKVKKIGNAQLFQPSINQSQYRTGSYASGPCCSEIGTGRATCFSSRRQCLVQVLKRLQTIKQLHYMQFDYSFCPRFPHIYSGGVQWQFFHVHFAPRIDAGEDRV
jgi:hypothetical protein